MNITDDDYTIFFNDSNSMITTPRPLPRCTDRFKVMPIDNLRFSLLLFGSACSLFGVVANALIFVVLLSDRTTFRSSFIFLLVLAPCDLVMSITYVPAVVFDRLKHRMYFLNSDLLGSIEDMWAVYFWPAMTITHIVKTLSAYLILSATIDRFVITCCKPKNRTSLQTRRYIMLTLSIVIALAIKLPIFFEVEMSVLPCVGLGRWRPRRTGLFLSKFYANFVAFYARNLFSIFIPFVLLSYFNARIVMKLRKVNRRASMFRPSFTAGHKAEVRAATRMMVVIVCTYLISNILNIVLTAWEHIDIKTLMFSLKKVWHLLADLVTLSSLLTCSTKIFIYCLCAKGFHERLIAVLAVFDLAYAFCHFFKLAFALLYSVVMNAACFGDRSRLDHLREQANAQHPPAHKSITQCNAIEKMTIALTAGGHNLRRGGVDHILVNGTKSDTELVDARRRSTIASLKNQTGTILVNGVTMTRHSSQAETDDESESEIFV